MAGKTAEVAGKVSEKVGEGYGVVKEKTGEVVTKVRESERYQQTTQAVAPGRASPLRSRTWRRAHRGRNKARGPTGRRSRRELALTV